MATRMEVWKPKYSDPRGQCALLKKEVVDGSDDVIQVIFTKAKHLLNRKFFIGHEKAMTYPVVSNGVIKCYSIPIKDLYEP